MTTAGAVLALVPVVTLLKTRGVLQQIALDLKDRDPQDDDAQYMKSVVQRIGQELSQFDPREFAQVTWGVRLILIGFAVRIAYHVVKYNLHGT